jgi:hypothetical protein
VHVVVLSLGEPTRSVVPVPSSATGETSSAFWAPIGESAASSVHTPATLEKTKTAPVSATPAPGAPTAMRAPSALIATCAPN